MVIAEDWHVFLRGLFGTGGRRDPAARCSCPTSGDSVTGETIWEAFRIFYKQRVRHAWGCQRYRLHPAAVEPVARRAVLAEGGVPAQGAARPHRLHRGRAVAGHRLCHHGRCSMDCTAVAAPIPGFYTIIIQSGNVHQRGRHARCMAVRAPDKPPRQPWMAASASRCPNCSPGRCLRPCTLFLVIAPTFEAQFRQMFGGDLVFWRTPKKAVGELADSDAGSLPVAGGRNAISNEQAVMLCHPTSFPSRFGIGDLGKGAYDFVDWLATAKQQLWQVLPLGPTGYGDSPYQCFSAFAGNPLLISPEGLAYSGLLPHRRSVRRRPISPPDRVDFGPVIAVQAGSSAPGVRPLQDERHRLRSAHGLRVVPGAERGLAARLRALHGNQRRTTAAGAGTTGRATSGCASAAAMARAAAQELADEVELPGIPAVGVLGPVDGAQEARSGEKGIQIIGDVPIFVAEDSADVWANPEQFKLDEEGNPTVDRRSAARPLLGDRAALGQPALQLAPDETRRLQLVDQPHRSRPSSSSTSSGSTISAALPPPGKSRQARRTRSRASGSRRRVTSCSSR